MKCPRCGKNSLILKVTAWSPGGETHYCLMNPLGGTSYENGCGEYFKIPTDQHSVKSNKPLDPWGASVDTRGYPSREKS